MGQWSYEKGAPSARVWGVAALVQAVGDALATRFPSVVVRGEISGFSKAASGHGYFTLKDEHGHAALRCAMFRRALSQTEFQPGDGMLVEARGNLAVYEARGELQLVVDGLQRAGAGALYEQFLRLKARLEAEGLFASDRKRAIARFPRRVAVVTSLQAAALHDVLTALRRRAPHVEVVVAPCAVQGAEAPAQIVDALASVRALHQRGERVDGVILCRGGGSLEDLWSFNDERVVRAVAACPVPVVCGVGHETDVTLADFAADVRAPTPTAAAELIAQDRETGLAQLQAAAKHLQHRIWQRLDGQAQRLDQAAMRLARPAQVVGRQGQALHLLAHRLRAACQGSVRWGQQRLPEWQARMGRAARGELTRRSHALDAGQARLEALNPRRVLDRGYAWLSHEDGAPITKAAQVTVGDVLTGVMADGVLHLNVTDVQSTISDPERPA